MPRHSMTYQPQNEKRWWIPFKQTLTIIGSSSISALLAVDVIPTLRVDKPIETALLIGFSIGTAWLAAAFWDANHPRPAKLKKAPALSYEMGINDTTSVLIATTNKTEKAPIQGGDLHSPFIATIEIDRLRVMACRIVYQKYDFGVNTWTSNGGGEGFFKKNNEYLPLRQVLLDHKMLTWKSKTNRGNGVLITNLGMRYFRAVVRDYPPPTPAEFEQKYGIDPMELL